MMRDSRVVVVALFIACAVSSCGSRSVPGPTCASGQTSCTNACADVATDPNNCGACGNLCPSSQVCYVGSCATSCGGGTTQCGQSCFDTQVDVHHCGDCNTICSLGLACLNGACSSGCGNEQTLCTPPSGTYCANTQSDNANCGTCGNACAPWMTCASGVCTMPCAPGLTACGEQCVDFQTDTGNCGACATTCTVCDSGRCIVEIAPPTGTAAYGVVADASTVYWADQYGVYSVSSQPPFVKKTIYTSFNAGPFIGVAADASHVAYWTNSWGAMSYNGSVTTLASNYYLATSLALDSSNVYWISKSGLLQSVPKGGGTVVNWATGAGWDWTLPHAVATDGLRLFWSTQSAILAMPSSTPDAGAPAILVDSEWEPGPLAVDANNLYWMSSVGLRGVAKGGGPAWTIEPLVYGADLAIDASQAYYVANGLGVKRAPLSGGNVTNLVDAAVYGGGQSIGVSIDPTSVFWTMYSGPHVGSVWKATPR